MTELLTIIHGDALEKLRELPDASVQCCITSPPYWGLRDYGSDSQIGLEKTPEEYVAKMLVVFREVRRVLRDDGALWLNLGDSYANDTKWGGTTGGIHANGLHGHPIGRARKFTGLKPKDLMGIPWRVAFALQADGWWLRQDIVWAKPNPMPESVTDRCTKAHEYLFLLTKSARYFYDAEAIKEGGSGRTPGNVNYKYHGLNGHDTKQGILAQSDIPQTDRNKRSVWTVATAAYPEAHFATYPPDLIKPCILAGTSFGDTVLDTFAGSGTTGAVAIELGRKAVLIELNPGYIDLIRDRCNITPGLELSV